MKCPDCKAFLNDGATRCKKCGWVQGQVGAGKQPIYQRCDECGETFRYHRKGESHNYRNRIIGRSARGGFICYDCYSKLPPPYELPSESNG